MFLRKRRDVKKMRKVSPSDLQKASIPLCPIFAPLFQLPAGKSAMPVPIAGLQPGVEPLCGPP